jgi:hypothetical protein
MKDDFPAFYRPTAEEFDTLWKKCTFIFDANVLLNLYRYSPETRLELINTLQTLQSTSQLWLPHQAILEYHKNRLGVIINEKSKFKQISLSIDKHIKGLKDDLKKEDRDRKNTYTASIITTLEKVIDKNMKEITDELDRQTKGRPDWIKKDDIREKLSELLKGKIGTPYDDNKLENIYKKAQMRYDLKIPPGYKDAEEKEGYAKYGDVVLWFQIIDYAEKNKLPVIFVTDDTKEDWWNPETEDNDKQPAYELIQEFTSKTGCTFFMYSPDRFLFWAKKQIGAKVSDKTIEEIQQVKSFQDAINANKKNQLKPEQAMELMTAVIQSPALTNIVTRQMKGEKIDSTEILNALANTTPEISSKVIRAILASQKTVKEGDIIS